MSEMPLVRPFVSGEWVDGDAETVTVLDKFSDAPVASVETSSAGQARDAVGAAVAGWKAERLPQSERQRVLFRAAELVRERCAELMAAVAADTGFVDADVVKEVDRAADTLLLCAEEARRLAGDVVPVQAVAGKEGSVAYTRLDPLGVVCAITPFNSPLNTVVHKIGPAIAAGNGVIVKPADQTPRSMDLLLRVLLDAGLPPRLVTALYGPGSVVGQALIEDPRIAYYAFTGSTAVGERIHASAGLRRTQLEMGSIASTIICADADLARATDVVLGAGLLRKSGQVCTSVQRLYVEAPAVDSVLERLVGAVKPLVAGDPRAPETAVGPLISPGDAVRVKSWIDEAVADGAELVAGGGREGNVVEPTVLTRTPADTRIMQHEVFGPVVLVQPFERLDDAIAEANATPYGLASGIFTSNIGTALDAADRLQTGAVYINESSSSRVDVMPFQGMKASGFGGAEGPRYAVRDMSQERLVAFSRP